LRRARRGRRHATSAWSVRSDLFPASVVHPSLPLERIRHPRQKAWGTQTRSPSKQTIPHRGRDHSGAGRKTPNYSEVDRRDPLGIAGGPRVRVRVQPCLQRPPFASVRCYSNFANLQDLSATRNSLQLVFVDFQSQGRWFESSTAHLKDCKRASVVVRCDLRGADDNVPFGRGNELFCETLDDRTRRIGGAACARVLLEAALRRSSEQRSQEGQR
jgi:hypothetical protein